jgi:hypothetical protein
MLWCAAHSPTTKYSHQVPITIDSRFTDAERAEVVAAINEIERHTCVVFRARTTSDTHWVHAYAGGCSFIFPHPASSRNELQTTWTRATPSTAGRRAEAANSSTWDRTVDIAASSCMNCCIRSVSCTNSRARIVISMYTHTCFVIAWTGGKRGFRLESPFSSLLSNGTNRNIRSTCAAR